MNIPSLADMVGGGNLYGGPPSAMLNPASLQDDLALNRGGYGLPSTQQGALQGNYGPYRAGQVATVLQPGITNIAAGYAGRPIPQSGYERVLGRAPGPLRAGMSMPDRMVGPDQSISTLGDITGPTSPSPAQNWSPSTINLADMVAGSFDRFRT